MWFIDIFKRKRNEYPSCGYCKGIEQRCFDYRIGISAKGVPYAKMPNYFKCPQNRDKIQQQLEFLKEVKISNGT